MRKIPSFVFGLELPPMTRMVLAVLWNEALEVDGSHVLWPSTARLAEETKQGPERVRRHLRELVKAGLIERNGREILLIEKQTENSCPTCGLLRRLN